jgi:hypothetical protein
MSDKEISVPLELVENFVFDLRKKDIDPIDKANILKKHMEVLGFKSQRQYATHLGISKSTLEDWMMYNRITKPEYHKLLNNGFTKRDVYKQLRTHKLDAVGVIIEKPYADLLLEETEEKLDLIFRTNDVDKSTLEKIDRLKVLLDRVKVHVKGVLKSAKK